MSLTEAGQTYFERVQNLLDELDAVEASLQSQKKGLSGRLVVSAPVTFGEMYLVNAVAEFGKQEPLLSVELRLTDRQVNLVDEGVDMAVRIANLESSSAFARKLASTSVLVCAAPRYLETYGIPKEPGELSAHRCIVDTNFRTPFEWSFKQERHSKRVAIQAQILVNSARASRDLVLSAQGIGLLPSYAICDALKDGRLKMLFKDYSPMTLDIHAIYPHRRYMAPKIRAFIDFLVPTFARLDWL